MAIHRSGTRCVPYIDDANTDDSRVGYALRTLKCFQR